MTDGTAFKGAGRPYSAGGLMAEKVGDVWKNHTAGGGPSLSPPVSCSLLSLRRNPFPIQRGDSERARSDCHQGEMRNVPPSACRNAFLLRLLRPTNGTHIRCCCQAALPVCWPPPSPEPVGSNPHLIQVSCCKQMQIPSGASGRRTALPPEVQVRDLKAGVRSTDG